MTFTEKLETIERVDQRTRLKATGGPAEVSQKFGVASSTVYLIVGCMKELGTETNYRKLRKSFYYETENLLAISFLDSIKIRIRSS